MAWAVNSLRVCNSEQAGLGNASPYIGNVVLKGMVSVEFPVLLNFCVPRVYKTKSTNVAENGGQGSNWM